MKDTILIASAGYGSTGSSAITDYISEFLDVTSLGANIEFQLLTEPDGFFSLEDAVVSSNSLIVDTAVNRFIRLYKDFKSRFPQLFDNKSDYLLKDFFKDINLITWDGGWYGSEELLEKTRKNDVQLSLGQIKFNKILKKYEYAFYESDTAYWQPVYYDKCTQFFCNVTVEVFRKALRKYLHNFFDILNTKQNHFICIDHIVPPSCNKRYQEYFDNLMTICVDRDPVDLYLANVLGYGERWLPTEDVDIFISWFKETRKHRVIDELDNTKYMVINFSELVCDYTNTSKKINNFLGLDEKNHVFKFKYFDPNKSIQNLNLEKRFNLTEQLKNDVSKIKRELSDYCFNYDNFNFHINEKKETIPMMEIRKQCDNTFEKKDYSLKELLMALIMLLKKDISISYDMNSIHNSFKLIKYLKLLIRIFVSPWYFCLSIRNFILDFFKYLPNK